MIPAELGSLRAKQMYKMQYMDLPQKLTKRSTDNEPQKSDYRL